MRRKTRINDVFFMSRIIAVHPTLGSPQPFSPALLSSTLLSHPPFAKNAKDGHPARTPRLKFRILHPEISVTDVEGRRSAPARSKLCSAFSTPRGGHNA